MLFQGCKYIDNACSEDYYNHDFRVARLLQADGFYYFNTFLILL
jgi:hypothetical protein